MKTIRTIIATFGVTSLLYGAFALIAMHGNWAFTGRSIYQLFRDTGFIMLVIGIGCVLSFVIMTVALVSFRDEGTRRKHDILYDDPEEEFLEEETVPEERAEEADESWSPEIKRKQRRALRHTDEEPTPDLFGDDDPEEMTPIRIEEPEAFEPSGSRLRSTFREPVQEEPTPASQQPLQFGYAPEAEPNDPEPFMPEHDRMTVPEAEAAPKLRRCIYCGRTIEADSAFCIYCGRRV
jgi:hypothetical protein